MSTAKKIQELTYIITHSADDRLINMVYALVKEYQADSDDVSLSDNQISELESRITHRKSGESTSHSWKEVKAKLKAI